MEVLVTSLYCTHSCKPSRLVSQGSPYKATKIASGFTEIDGGDTKVTEMWEKGVLRFVGEQVNKGIFVLRRDTRTRPTACIFIAWKSQFK